MPFVGRKASLLKRLLLAFASLALTLAVLELVARLYMPSLAPTKLRDGVYRNTLPLLTGTAGKPIPLRDLRSFGERLDEQKAAGELRIFVTGESSVDGSPFDVHASMPTMLYDELRRAFPKRSLTVVNLGRSSSIAANTFYYVLYMRRYEPDYVVFYMGMNDADGMPGEQCAPARHPRLHRAWRSLVSSSWAAWLVRAYGPQLLWSVSPRKSWYPPKDCPEQTFATWTGILTREARAMGAKVVIATPVVSAAAQLEATSTQDESSDLPILKEDYLETLRCTLDDGCDLINMLHTSHKHLRTRPQSRAKGCLRGGAGPAPTTSSRSTATPWTTAPKPGRLPPRSRERRSSTSGARSREPLPTACSRSASSPTGSTSSPSATSTSPASSRPVSRRT